MDKWSANYWQVFVMTRIR